MHSLKNAVTHRIPSHPPGVRKPLPKKGATSRAGSDTSTERRVETDTESIAVLGYN